EHVFVGSLKIDHRTRSHLIPHPRVFVSCFTLIHLTLLATDRFRLGGTTTGRSSSTGASQPQFLNHSGRKYSRKRTRSELIHVLRVVKVRAIRRQPIAAGEIP